MKNVIIRYEAISPAVLANIVEKSLNCVCNWVDIDEDCFEFQILFCDNLAEAERLLAPYV